MRLLWYSNAPWAGTGYGTQTAQVLRRIKALGHDLAIANNYGLQATQGAWEGIPILPVGYDGHSRDVLQGHAAAFNADWILTLYDVWVFDRAQYADKRVASWVPVDHDPAPPDVVEWCKQHYSIAMSEFGRDALAREGVTARYAPHAIDLDVWKPTPSDIRARWGIPDDAFVVMVNAANKGLPPRKAWPEMLTAFAEFARRHDDVYLYLHTEVEGIINGLRLPLLMVKRGIDPARVRIVPQYEYAAHRISSIEVAAFYTASDVLLSTSMGEGFGLAVLEAQACGTPVIVTDFTAQPELVGAGWTVGYQRYWDWTQGSDWATPLIPDIVDRLERAYAAKGDARLREAAIEFARQYDADKVFAERWVPILAELEAEIAPRQKRQGHSKSAKRRARKAA